MTTPQSPDASGTPLPDDALVHSPAGHPVGREGSRVDINERRAWAITGLPGILIALALLAVGAWLFLAEDMPEFSAPLGVVLAVIGLLLFSGLAVISPARPA